MKFDVSFLQPKLEQMPAYAAAAEVLGFDGFWVAETNSDPFLNLALTHNTLRGAASGALLNAELLAVQGYIGK